MFDVILSSPINARYSFDACQFYHVQFSVKMSSCEIIHAAVKN
jgi:hypothetical protein